MSKLTTNLREALDAAARDTGIDLKRSTADVAVYTAARGVHLAAIAGQPGIAEAIVAERDSVLLFAGVSAVRVADAGDARIIGLIHGALAVAAAGVVA